MKSTGKLLLGAGICVCLVAAFRAQRKQTSPLESTSSNDTQVQFRNTPSHRQVSRACAKVKRASKIRHENANSQNKPFFDAIKQLLAAQQPLVASQKLLEKQLTQKLPSKQRIFLQNDLADVNFALGHIFAGLQEPQLDQAIIYYQAAYKTDKSLRPINAGQALVSIGWAHFNQGRYSKGIMYWQQAIPLYESQNAKEHEVAALHSMVYGYQFMEHYDDALRTLQRSLPLARKIKSKKWEIRELSLFGDIYSLLGYNQEAMKYYHVVRSYDHKLQDKGGKAWASRNLAGLYMDSGDYNSALRYLNEAVSLYRELKANTAQEMTPEFGDLYMGMGRYKEAQRYYDSALSRARKEKKSGDEADFLSAIGNNKLKQHLDKEALALFKQAQPISDNRRATIHILTGITTAYANLKQPQQAIISGKRAINLLQAIRKENEKLDPRMQRAFLAGYRGLYERVAALLVKQNRLEEAEQVLRFLRQEDAFEFARPGSALAKELAGLSAPLVFAPDEKAQMSPEVAQTVREGRGCHESRLWQQALLKQEKAGWGRAALISTFNTDDTFYLLLTTAKDRRAFSYPIKKNNFEKLSARLYDEISSTDENPLPDAQQMYRIVFASGELEQALRGAGVTTALWFPSGSLRTIPIDVLHDGQEYLLSKPWVNVGATLTSHTLFGATARGSALAAGVSEAHTLPPDIPGEKPITLPPLPNVPRELRGIVSDVADGGTGPFPGKILLDPQCTAANLERNLALRPSIVHFAMHFVNTPSGGQDPYFLMGNGKRLSLSQWKQTLRLRGVGLLTLSACNTGVGTLDTSGGDVSSIGELSQYLGAQSVIMSLWSVDDKTTTALMRDFYARLHHNPQGGKAQALRDTQRALLAYDSSAPSTQNKRGLELEADEKPTASKDSKHPYAHPYYWAPFSLTGNWK